MKSTIGLIACLVAIVAGCSRSTECSDPVVWYDVYLLENGGSVSRIHGGYAQVPSEEVELDVPNDEIETRLRVLALDRKSVTLEITRNGEAKVGKTNNQHRADIDFDLTDKTVLSFAIIAGGQVAPFEHNDHRITQKFSVFRILPGWGNEHDQRNIRGRLIIESQVVESAEAREELNGILADHEQLSLGEGADCFDPHHALRFGEGAEQVDVLICFECWAVWVYNGPPKSQQHYDYDEYALCSDKSLRAFLLRYFPHDAQLAADD